MSLTEQEREALYRARASLVVPEVMYEDVMRELSPRRHYGDEELQAAAATMVAAELRRLADELSAIGYAHARVMRRVRSRADELDGGAS